MRREVPSPGNDLTECPIELPREIKAAVLRRLGEASWRRYPGREQPEVIASVAAHLRVDPQRVLLTKGASEAIALAIRPHSRTEAGILAPVPGFIGYGLAAKTQGIPLRGYPAQELPEPAAPESPHDGSPLIVCSPNNPTGHVTTVDYLIRAARTRPVICDLTYDPFADEPLTRHLTELTDAEVTCVISLSKAYGLAGARIGALVAAPEVLRRMAQAQEVFPLDYFQLAVAETLFGPDAPPDRDAGIIWVRRERRHVRELLARLAPDAVIGPCQANFVPLTTTGCEEDLIRRIVTTTDCKLSSPSSLLRVTVSPRTLSGLRTLMANSAG
ncbi:aminotransferase class I/II-fold pyridoxal phosphate-dependent enzyme [Streptomyces sp. NPDC050658]|uniref:aminotransferase class I/II-fold pyridoxal phosphate-dependent enzyme n=1 Tax=unclassified Streptomyces TaxID=2593676 RepID=UPI00341E8FD1